jgi:hypothetical protein
MYKYKNAQENKYGSIDCLILLGDDWVAHTQDPSMAYELHEESEWPEIKPCDPAEKAAHELQQAKDAAKQAVQSLIDGEAQARGYDDINACSKYAVFENSFKAESIALLTWCAACWDKLILIQDTAQSLDDVMEAMPEFSL